MSNEDISKLLVESAFLLDYNKDTDSLNEGVIGKIAAGVLLLPPIMFSAMYIFLSISSKISQISEKRKAKKLTKQDKMLIMKDYKEIINNYNMIIKKVKFVKYNPIVIPMMKDYIKFTEDTKREIDKIDKEFKSIKTVDEFYKKKKYFEVKYSTYITQFNSKYSGLLDKYKTIKSDWVIDNKVIPVLTEYMNFFTNDDNIYYKNINGDDYWEGLDVWDDLYTEKRSEKEDLKIEHDIYEVYSMVNNSHFNKFMNTLFKRPFGYIKMQFSGEEPNDGGNSKK